MKNLSEEMIRIHQLISFDKGKNTISESTQILEEGVKKQYKLLIEEGDELFSNGDYDGALAKYKEANNLFVDKPNHKFFIESQERIKNTEAEIEQKIKAEKAAKAKELLNKINSKLMSELTPNLKTLISDFKVKFGFNGDTYYMFNAETNRAILAFDSDGWGGKTNEISTKGEVAIKSLNSKDYKDKVLEGLTDEEKTNFELVGFVPGTTKSISEMFDNGVIGVWIKGLGYLGTNIITWERTQVTGGQSNMEKTGCSDVKAENIFKNGNEDVAYDKILKVEGDGELSASKKICYGSLKISNTSVGIGFSSPINDIMNS